MSDPYPMGMNHTFGHFSYQQPVDQSQFVQGFGMPPAQGAHQMMGMAPHPQMGCDYSQGYPDMGYSGGVPPGVGYPPMRGDPYGADMGGKGGRGGGGRGGKPKTSSLPSVTDPDGLRDDTVFVTGLPQNIDHEIMKTEFGNIGKVKMNATTKMPMIWIFKEKGIPKGDALVTFEDVNCVKQCVEHFKTNDFQGYKISVRQATNCERPVIIPPGGGGGGPGGGGRSNDRGGGMMRGGRGGAGNGGMRPYMAQPMMGYGMPFGAPGGQGDMKGQRNGDWECKECRNVNFAWRKSCNRCNHEPKPEEMKPVPKMPPMNRGGPPAQVRPNMMGPGRGGYGRGGPVPSGNMYMMPGGRGAGGPVRGGHVGARTRPAPY